MAIATIQLEMESLSVLSRENWICGGGRWLGARLGWWLYPWRVRQLDASLGTLASKAIIVEILFTYSTTLADLSSSSITCPRVVWVLWKCHATELPHYVEICIEMQSWQAESYEIFNRKSVTKDFPYEGQFKTLKSWYPTNIIGHKNDLFLWKLPTNHKSFLNILIQPCKPLSVFAHLTCNTFQLLSAIEHSNALICHEKSVAYLWAILFMKIPTSLTNFFCLTLAHI